MVRFNKMKDEFIKMENKNYDTSLAALQAFMHSFSRSPLATGQIYLDQATGKSRTYNLYKRCSC